MLCWLLHNIWVPLAIYAMLLHKEVAYHLTKRIIQCPDGIIYAMLVFT